MKLMIIGPEGICDVCSRLIQLKKDGTLYPHGWSGFKNHMARAPISIGIPDQAKYIQTKSSCIGGGMEPRKLFHSPKIKI